MEFSKEQKFKEENPNTVLLKSFIPSRSLIPGGGRWGTPRRKRVSPDPTAEAGCCTAQNAAGKAVGPWGRPSGACLSAGGHIPPKLLPTIRVTPGTTLAPPDIRPEP